jgi:hypothetical protein
VQFSVLIGISKFISTLQQSFVLAQMSFIHIYNALNYQDTMKVSKTNTDENYYVSKYVVANL